MDGEPELAPELAPLAWLLGTWEGAGVGGYPTIESFNFGQQVVFSGKVTRKEKRVGYGSVTLERYRLGQTQSLKTMTPARSGKFRFEIHPLAIKDAHRPLHMCRTFSRRLPECGEGQ